MRPPQRETLDAIIGEFIEHTSNDTMKIVVCACCACEVSASNASHYLISEIPNRHMLKPQMVHRDHDLFNSLLLEPIGVDSSTKKAMICNECHERLKQGKLLPLTLANDMWIGHVASQLSELTLAQRSLISMYFPTAYVSKLFPKHAGSVNWDPSQLYSRLKDNVSTYLLDPDLVADMVDGQLFPVAPKILYSTVAVTFITPSGKHTRGLPSQLHA